MPEAPPPQRLDLRDAELALWHGAFAEPEPLYRRLEAEIDWQQEEIRLFGRTHKVPRLVAWIGEAGYRYSGVDHPPAPWPPAVAEVRARVEDLTGHAFNGVLANLYRYGEEGMGWHADDEPELGAAPAVASASFGAARRFQLKRKDRTGGIETVELPSGSLLLMTGPTQAHWLHRVPKTKKPVGARINLTFRQIVG